MRHYLIPECLRAPKSTLLAASHSQAFSSSRYLRDINKQSQRCSGHYRLLTRSPLLSLLTPLKLKDGQMALRDGRSSRCAGRRGSLWVCGLRPSAGSDALIQSSTSQNNWPAVEKSPVFRQQLPAVPRHVTPLLGAQKGAASPPAPPRDCTQR